MDTTQSDSNIDINSEVIRRKAREIFQRVAKAELEGGMVLRERERLIDDGRTYDHFSQVESESVEQHLISSVVFRVVFRGSDADQWELESIFDSVNLSQLVDIRTYEDYFVSYDDDIRTAMVENPNIVLSRTIIDWSREDGNVWSHQTIWSGCFVECQRLVELFDNTPSSIDFRTEQFSLHNQMSGQFTYRHHNPVAASLSAVYSSPTILISEEQLDTGDDEGFLCSICRDRIPIGFPTKQLPCKHLFHGDCIAEWLLLQGTCPLCRHQLL